MAMYERILIATDGSEYTMAATMHGLHLAKLTGAEVTALFVMDDASYLNYPFGPMIPDLARVLEDEGRKATEAVLEEGKKLGVKVKTMIKRGSPSNAIVEETIFYDLVVMGTLGRTGVSKLLLGSVAEKTIRFSKCPVLVVRNPEMHKGQH